MAKSGLLSSLFGAQDEKADDIFEQDQAETQSAADFDVLDSNFAEMFDEETDIEIAAAPTQVPTGVNDDIPTSRNISSSVFSSDATSNDLMEAESMASDYLTEEAQSGETLTPDIEPTEAYSREPYTSPALTSELAASAAMVSSNELTDAELERERLSDEAMQKRREIHKIRADVQFFQEHLNQNELFASKARDNLKKMAEFMQESELELSTVDQLTHENKENTNRILQLSEELEDVRLTLIEKNVELVAETNRVGEIREMLEESRGENAELTERLNNATNEIRSINRVRNELENEHSALTIRLADAESGNRVFAETIERQSKELSAYLDSKSELEKIVEEQQKQQNRLHVQRDRMGAELLEKTETIRNLKEQSLELRSSNESLRKEVESKQRHAASKLKGREDEIFALKSEIDTLHSQLSVRKQMFNQAQNETNSARAIAKVAKDSVAEVEARLVSSNLQREIEQKNLVAANNELAELSGRYKSLLKQLDRVTSENESLRNLQQFYGEQADRAAHAAIESESGVIKTSQEPQAAAPKPKGSNHH